MLDIALLGSGGGMPMPNRYLSSLLIRYNGRKILVDCGEGIQVSMRILGWGFKSIDIICITHCHGDHIIGLPGLLSTIGNSGRTEPITIIGPEGITYVIDGLRRVVPYLPYDINIIENPKSRINIMENMDIKTLELDHSLPCVGYSFGLKRNPKFEVEKAIKNRVPKNLWGRLQDGETVDFNGIKYSSHMVLGQERKGIKLSYITDTRPIDTIPKFIYGSDLFICEGTYGEEKDLDKAIKNKHMTFSEAALLAKKGNVEELLLTHFSPAIEEPKLYEENAKNIFSNTIIGIDRFIKTLAFKDE
ncbi:ribonuclease Z [Anaerosalibacter bizertensis]|uniref:Ribonuclease Z n=1 Tax=Anaerosalibacter bizertensis TaxID=932217 RepID=A0A844FFH2_9FIRM|nr:ribonuclease Z [Anaerosalibacter bizertensis]MSS42718.1 ribonuclease Z [Anaerosalibacter bizertensis]